MAFVLPHFKYDAFHLVFAMRAENSKGEKAPFVFSAWNWTLEHKLGDTFIPATASIVEATTEEMAQFSAEDLQARPASDFTFITIKAPGRPDATHWSAVQIAELRVRATDRASPGTSYTALIITVQTS